MLPFHLVILGPAGSGKGTQSQFLSRRFKMPYLGAGELIRKKAEEKSALGKKIKTLHDDGTFIPHKITKTLFEERLKNIPQNQTVIFDGYPRFPKQIEDFEDILKKRKAKDMRAVVIKIGEKTIYKRLMGRRVCSSCKKNYYPPKSLALKKCSDCQGKLIKRSDDTQKAIKQRLTDYKKETEPVIRYFREKGVLLEVNGEPKIPQVNKEVIQKISALLEQKS